MSFYTTYVKIDLDAIAENFDAIARQAGKKVMAVIKADAYGHGAVQLARLLQGKCDFFALATISEALELRNNGITTPLMVLGYTPEAAFPQAIEKDIRLAVFNYDAALALSAEAVRMQKTAYIHLAIDTGMSRLGFQPTAESAALCAEIAKLPNLCAEGLFSHFATADSKDLTRTKAQIAKFDRFDTMLKEKGVNIPIRHLDNSAGILHFGCKYEMVRAGIILYGMRPSGEMLPMPIPLRPALQWLTQIVHIQTLPAGREISYGGTFVTQRPTKAAILPVGYADGYRRNLSNRFYVLIRGKKAPILGRVCMDQIIVDVTDIPDVQLHDEVVLIGVQGCETITIDEISEKADSFNYEFACNIHHRRCPRIYYQQGVAVETDSTLPQR